MPPDFRNKLQIACLHPYLEQRRPDIEKGLYPRHHLWGIDAIEKMEGWQATLLSTCTTSIPDILEKILNRYLFRSSPGARVEIAAWKAFKSFDLVFSVCGPLSLAKFRKKAKLVSWVFGMQNHRSLHSRHPYSKENLNSHSGFLCLTPKAQRSFSPFAKAEFIPWCVDLKLFDGQPAKEQPEHPFFLATGKTGRDYHSLVEASKSVRAEVKIIGPLDQRPPEAPQNVTWINSSTDPPDQAIDYPTLRKWYSQCTAVCIPLSGDAEDTCGYTNLLEGMAMAKPVLMTKSGCLHLNPEERGLGTLIDPKDPKGWASAMNSLLCNSQKAEALGKTGRVIAEEEFSIERFERKTISFLQQIVDVPN